MELWPLAVGGGRTIGRWCGGGLDMNIVRRVAHFIDTDTDFGIGMGI